MQVYMDVYIPRKEEAERSEGSYSIFGRIIELASRPMFDDRIDLSTFTPDDYQGEDVNIPCRLTRFEHTKGIFNGERLTILHVDAELEIDDELSNVEIINLHEALTAAGWDNHSIR